MLTMTKSGSAVDYELLEAMVEAGFQEITLPFEFVCQRVLNKYATGKLDLRTDPNSLIRACKDLGLLIGGNYLYGYPDETYDELTETILVAQKHMDAGLDWANLMIAVPFLGTVLYDDAIRGGHLMTDFDPDTMNWMYSTMRNTLITPEVLSYVSKICWRLLNLQRRLASVASKKLELTTLF